MGGSHKKKIRAEKAKVKLKGAKLPKGLNITKTEFKVRKIVLREQLKGTPHLDGEKQVNLKEILSKLKHHSSNVRIEALRNLRDAIGIKHPCLLSSLSNIIQGVSAISLDVEKDARRDSFKTMSSLLDLLSSEAVYPFFHIISSYLCCAMTHIQAVIREDSLLLLDILLQHVPHLVAGQSTKIFKNFLEMISSVRSEGDKAGRMLTVNMGQRQTTIRWRSKVLLRLQQMLQSLVEHKCNISDIAITPKNNIYVTFSTKTNQYYGLKRRFASNKYCDSSSIFSRSSCSMAQTDEQFLSDESRQLRSYAEHLMPLLLESWLEVRPQQESTSNNMESLLTPDAAITLKIILEIIENLWSLIEIYEKQAKNNDLSIWLRSQYADIFAVNFLLDAYPYQHKIFEESDGIVKRKNKKSSMEVSSHCFQQNITIAFLICRFYSNALDAQRLIFINILNYVTKVVDLISSKISTDHQRVLVLAIRALLLENGLKLLHLHKDGTTILLKRCINAFLTNKFSELGISSKIVILLCEIVQDSELFEAYGSEEFSEFLEHLPKLLLKPTVNESCLVAMGKLGKQQNILFLNALRSSLFNVVDQLQTIQVIGAINAFEGKKHIMNLFYWLNPQITINKDELRKLLNNVKCKITDKRISDYCQYILTTA